jgi:hypothetical protein
VILEQTQLAPGEVTQIRVNAAAYDQTAFTAPAARVEKDGRFALDGIPAGRYLLRASGAASGWMLKSVIIDGREVIDTPVELKAKERLTGVRMVFTDRLSEVSGSVADQRGAPVVELTVLAFPTDQSLWRPQARQILTTRPDQNGRYQLRGLPPGEYYLATVDPARQGEWFEPAFLDEHRAGAARMTLGEGESKTQDFKIAVQ